MEEVDDYRKWDEVMPELLGLIFKNLPLVDLLTVVPTVCKPWGRAVLGPYCWQDIDIVEWSKCRKIEIVERMIRLLISRSSGSLRKLSVCGLAGDHTIFLIANNAPCLETLQVPRSKMSNAVIERAAPMLSRISRLDLSYCVNIGAPALESIGKHCECLTSLRRVMYPIQFVRKCSQDEEAVAIASTMPRLKHLQIAYCHLDASSVVNIVEKCKQLEFLDVQGCCNVGLDDKFFSRYPKLKVTGPIDYFDWDNLANPFDPFCSAVYNFSLPYCNANHPIF